MRERYKDSSEIIWFPYELYPWAASVVIFLCISLPGNVSSKVEKDICLMDIATIAMKELRKQGKLEDLDVP